MDIAPILVTGFEPYGGRSVNPALDIMRALDGRTIAGATVIGRGLPVSYTSLPARIETVLDELAPSAIISLGLSPGEPLISIERLALNIADFNIADNDGTLVVDGKVHAEGSAARFASLPIREIESDLLAAGIPARLSISAGTFLCNACLYTFLDALERRSRNIPCGFIHVPSTPELVAAALAEIRSRQKVEQRNALASMELSRMVRAVETAITTTLRVLFSKD